MARTGMRRRGVAAGAVTGTLAAGLVTIGVIGRSSVVAAAPPMPTEAIAQQVIPRPLSITARSGHWVSFGASSRLVVPPDERAVRDVAELLAASLRPATGMPWPVVEHTCARPDASNADVVLSLDAAVEGDEAYRLIAQEGSVRLRARSAAGLFRATQTLRQLMPPAVFAPTSQRAVWRVPDVTISDTPRYAWRGAMLDVARHFFTVEQVERFIDLIALYKLNVLHLHLTDDQGWRIAVDAWPRLATHGGSTSVDAKGGGYYTRGDYARLVAYAHARHITVVPEIETPSHSNAALASYAELNCDGKAPELYTGIKVGFSSFCVGKDLTYRCLDDVFGELAALTPGPYLHFGGDEVETLSAAEYNAFVERVQDIVIARGKIPIGWEEIAHSRLRPTAIVQQWRAGRAAREGKVAAATAAAVAQGAKFILSPASKVYLDMKYHEGYPLGLEWAGLVELRDAYEWDPSTLFPGVTDANTLGIETALWTETIVTLDDIWTMVLPRLPAVAEVAWSQQGARRWDDFAARIASHAGRWRALGVRFHPSPSVAWEAPVR